MYNLPLEGGIYLDQTSKKKKKKDVLFILEDQNPKVGSQEIPGVTVKFGLGVKSEAEKRLTEFSQENTLVIAKPSSNNPRDYSTHEHHQMVNIEIRLNIFLAAKDREALYIQQKQDLELTVAQITLLQNSGLS